MSEGPVHEHRDRVIGGPRTEARPELHFYAKPHVVIVQCNEDPGDMGEPRVVSEDDTTYVFVPAFALWPGGEARDAIEAELRARGWQDEYEVATAAAMNFGEGRAEAAASAAGEVAALREALRSTLTALDAEADRLNADPLRPPHFGNGLRYAALAVGKCAECSHPIDHHGHKELDGRWISEGKCWVHECRCHGWKPRAFPSAEGALEG